ncbi:MAG: hypothetical protein IJ274_09780 [Lachnospiraceae bacterium]|nr:hypothetical protein [Lachnospiraceae bacterium]
MKKTYVKKSIVLLLAVSMVFSVAACGKKENTSEKQMMSEEDKDAVYTYETIEWDEEIRENIGGVQFAGDIMYATLGDYNEETEEYLSYFVTFDMQGKELSRFEINNGWDEETGTSYGVNQFKMSNNQEIYGIGYTYMNSEDEATGEWIWEEFYSLMKFDNQGNVLWENSVGSSGSQQIEDGGNYYSVNNLLCDEKGNVWVLDSVAYTCYDKDGNQGVSIAAPENVSGDAWFNKEGNIIFGQWDDNWENIDFYEIDTKAGQIKKEPLTKPGGYYQYSYYSGIGSKWDMYATNSVGVWAFNWGDTEMTKVMDYLLSDFDGTNIYNIKAISNDKFMANYYDMDWNYNAGVFTKVPKEDVVDKYIMNLACYYIDSNVRKQIVEFNRSHEDVRITLTDYSSLDNEENDWTLGTETLNSDILSGKVPDILVVPSDFDMGMYANKGLFADMYQFIEQDEDINLDDYLDNIIALGEYNGELYELIPKFNAVTLVGKKADVGDRFSWTFSDVNALMNQKGQDVNLFSRDSAMRSTVMYYGINLAFDQFYDSNTGECHFDSPEFAQFLEMLKGYPEETTEVWNDEEYWQEYETQWRNGSTILKYEHIYSFRNYVEDSQGYLGEPKSYIGFPTREGSGSSAYVEFSLAISEESAFKDEAWDFVSYFIKDEYQESIEGGFPVKMTAIDKKAEEEMKPNTWVDEVTGEEIVEDMYFWVGGEEIILEMPTKEECEYVVGFLKQIDYRQRNVDDITAIIDEDAAAYFDGQKTAQQVSDSIQSRVKIFISEKR